jgi:hypothetical protein
MTDAGVVHYATRAMEIWTRDTRRTAYMCLLDTDIDSIEL